MTKQLVKQRLGHGDHNHRFCLTEATPAFIEVWNIAGPWKFEPGNKEIFDV
jgi:hypothetical protein